MPLVRRLSEFIQYEAEDVVANTITIDWLGAAHPHCFASVQFFDAQGDPVVPGAGTVTITAKTVNSDVFEDPADNVIDATAPHTVDWGANTSEIRAVPTGITTAVTYKLVVTGNRV